MSLALTRLLQLASPALPVGAYTYSQGLEWAVESGVVSDEASARQWIGDQLEWNLARFEAPLLARMIAAARAGDAEAMRSLDAQYLASRETAELRAETLQMGHSLKRLVSDLGEDIAIDPTPTYPAAWSAVAAAWEIDARDALAAWLWSWVENQAMAAIKTVPLGQAAGQRILLALGARIPAAVAQALMLDEDNFSNFAPGFAIACARHETQYSRLFRS